MATALPDLKVRLNIWLRDTNNTTFSDAEKTEILTEVINDPYVYGIKRDATTTIVAGQYSYPLPTGIGAVYRLGIDLYGDGIMRTIPRDSYEVANGVIYLSTKTLPVGRALIVIGKDKYTSATSDFPVKVQEYILHMACAAAFEMLKSSLTARFLKNAITMSDLVQSIATHKQRAAELRSALINQHLVEL